MLNQEQELRFCKARRASIARDFGTLNPAPQTAVLDTAGPRLLRAAAGFEPEGQQAAPAPEREPTARRLDAQRTAVNTATEFPLYNPQGHCV